MKTLSWKEIVVIGEKIMTKLPASTNPTRNCNGEKNDGNHHQAQRYNHELHDSYWEFMKSPGEQNQRIDARLFCGLSLYT